jgi:hypothetical protein
VPDLFLGGIAQSFDIAPCAKLRPACDLLELFQNKPKSPVLALFGYRLEDFPSDFRRELSPETLSDFVAIDNNGQVVVDPFSGNPLFVPSAKYVQLCMNLGNNLAEKGTSELVFWQPHVPIAEEVLTPLMKQSLFAADTRFEPEEGEATSTFLRRACYAAILQGVDRIITGIQDFGARRTNSAPFVWTASYSWAGALSNGYLTPLLIPRGRYSPSGHIAVILPFENSGADRLPRKWNLSPFEWVYFQAATSAAVAELFNCPLVLAPLEDGGDNRLPVHAAIAAHLVASRRAKLLLGWAPTSTSAAHDSTSSALEIQDACSPFWPILANVFAHEKPTSVRWDSGTRSLGVAISDGAFFAGDPRESLAHLLALWLPSLRAGFTPRAVAIEALRDPRLIRSFSMILADFSNQMPRRPEIEALANWTKQGGLLVLFDDRGRATRISDSPQRPLSAGDSLTTESAQMALFKAVGLPAVLPEGIYHVDNGWLYYSQVDPLEFLTRDDGIPQFQSLLQKIADTASVALVSRPQIIVHHGATIAGYVSTRGTTTKLSGDFIDLTTTTLRLLHDPSYVSGDAFLLRAIVPGARRPANGGFLAANAAVALETTRSSLTVKISPSCFPSSAGPLLWLRAPDRPFAIEDSASAAGLQYESYSQLGLIRVTLCPETKSVEVRPLP